MPFECPRPDSNPPIYMEASYIIIPTPIYEVQPLALFLSGERFVPKYYGVEGSLNTLIHCVCPLNRRL
jgi:hypothetical protein